MHGSHICNSLYNFHVLHVPCYPSNPFIQLDLIPYQMFYLQILSPTLISSFYLNSSLIFTKLRVEVMATLCSYHMPLRKYFPKIIISQIKLFLFLFQKTLIYLLYFDHKTISSFIKYFHLFSQIK
jgi:hypothetical protein